MSQVDRREGLVGNTAIKAPVRAATTATITHYGEQTIDSIACVTGDRVLDKDNTDATLRGIWVVDTGDWSRAQDFDGALDIVKGTIVTVNEGAINARTLWRVSSSNPITINSSSITFEANVASSTDASNINYLPAGTGAVATDVQEKFRQIKHIRDFGGTWDGITADDDAWALALASGYPVIDARATLSKVTTTLTIPNDTVLLVDGLQVNIVGTAFKLFNQVRKDRWSTLGRMMVVGDLVTNPGETVTSAAVYIEDCAEFYVGPVYGKNIQGSVIQYEPGSNITPRSGIRHIENPIGSACVWGVRNVTAGAGAEYIDIVAPYFTGMAGAGFDFKAGNLNVTGGNVTDNFDGVRVGGGSNNAHGTFSGTFINHNTNLAIHAKDVTNGHTFVGCHIYGNTGVNGPVWLENSKGVHITDGVLEAAVYNDSGGSSGTNYLLRNYCPGADSTVQILNVTAGKEQLRVQGNYGPGSYVSAQSINTPSNVFVYSERAAGNQLTVTSATLTTLLCPTASANGNRLGVLDGSGIYTITDNESGIYRIEGLQVFETSGAFTSGSSYLLLEKDVGSGYVTVDVFTPEVSYSGTVLTVNHNSMVYCAFGTKFRLRAYITGSGTITHSSANYRSWASLQRVDGL